MGFSAIPRGTSKTLGTSRRDLDLSASRGSPASDRRKRFRNRSRTCPLVDRLGSVDGFLRFRTGHGTTRTRQDIP